jgi:hypothetical protein
MNVHPGAFDQAFRRNALHVALRDRSGSGGSAIATTATAASGQYQRKCSHTCPYYRSAYFFHGIPVSIPIACSDASAFVRQLLVAGSQS